MRINSVPGIGREELGVEVKAECEVRLRKIKCSLKKMKLFFTDDFTRKKFFSNWFIYLFILFFYSMLQIMRAAAWLYIRVLKHKLSTFYPYSVSECKF